MTAFWQTADQEFFEKWVLSYHDVIRLLEVLHLLIYLILRLLDFEQPRYHVVVEGVEVPYWAHYAEDSDADATEATHIRQHVKDCVDFPLVLSRIEVHLDSDTDPCIVKLLVWEQVLALKTEKVLFFDQSDRVKHYWIVVLEF